MGQTLAGKNSSSSGVRTMCSVKAATVQSRCSARCAEVLVCACAELRRDVLDDPGGVSG